MVLHLSAAGQSLYLVQLVHQDIQGSVEFQDTLVQVYLDIQGLVESVDILVQVYLDTQDLVDIQALMVPMAHQDLVDIQDIQDQGSVDIRAIADQGFQVSAVIQDILELDRLGLAALHLHGSFQDKGSKC